jgi:hypothetical protein
MPIPAPLAALILSLSAAIPPNASTADVAASAVQGIAAPAVAVEVKPPAEPDFPYRVVVKFKNDLKVRVVGGRLVDAGRSGGARSDDADASESAKKGRVADGLKLAGEQAVPARFPELDPSIEFVQLLQLPQETIEFLEERARKASGRPQPDLASMIELRGPREAMPAAVALLHASPIVEWVQYEMLTPPPPVLGGCTDFAPATPNYVALQGYRGANPGLNMDAFWLLGNARGAGIKIADCEYWYEPDHEDLCGVIPEPGQTPNSTVITNGWHHHGTAVLGELVGTDNAYGVKGLAPDATAYFFPEWTVQGGSRRATAIAQASATLAAGDVILLEMQTSITGGSNYGPAELDLSVWTIAKNATAAGIIVVGAAGNGNQDLDGASYASYRARGDSGALIVGAGSATVQHSKLSFSTFGSRVNVQGWGTSVFTLGYGSYSQLGGDVRQTYTSGFNGTSSASPFIAASCATLQSFAVANIGRRLSPLEMRTILTTTGWPQQGAGGSIGSFPNLVAASAAVLALVPSPDINRDGIVNSADLSILLSQWGSCGACSADLDGNGSVGSSDLARLLAAWGTAGV